MLKLHQIIENHWQRPKPFLRCALKPFSYLFAQLAEKRRTDFESGRLKSEKLIVPVVVVGNIHAGGTGKTPIVAALVQGLQARGVNVGVISRGYGRKSKAICVLNEKSRAEECGDEPLLLYRKTGAPTAVGRDRVAAGRALLIAHPDIELIVADDGLQHYALRRDVEIAVFPFTDTARQDLDLLPNGNLREPLSRLDSVDAVVVNGGNGSVTGTFRPSENMFAARVEAGEIYRLNQPNEKLDLSGLVNQKVAAAAGIARPKRFFDSLENMGINLAEIVALPDHANLTPSALPQADVVLITEKDAVKLSDGLELNHVWVLPICAIIEPDLADFVLGRLKNKMPHSV